MYKKPLLTLLLTLFLLSLSTTQATTSLQPTGTTLYVGGTGPGNYTTITEAINASTDGDTIYIYPGTYYESLTITKSLTITGHDKDTTHIESNTTAFTITAPQTTIQELTIQAFNIGIRHTTNRVSIIENHLHHCTTAIYVERSIVTPTFTNIQDNTITNSQWAILIQGSLNNIMNNDLQHNNIGLDLQCMLTNINFNKIDNGTNAIILNGLLNNIGRNALTHQTTALTLTAQANNIHHNNFLYNTNNTYMELSFGNRFLNNFWTKPRLTPYPIRGIIPLGGTDIAYYDFDPFPKFAPNAIPP